MITSIENISYTDIQTVCTGITHHIYLECRVESDLSITAPSASTTVPPTVVHPVLDFWTLPGCCFISEQTKKDGTIDTRSPQYLWSLTLRLPGACTSSSATRLLIYCYKKKTFFVTHSTANNSSIDIFSVGLHKKGQKSTYPLQPSLKNKTRFKRR